MRMQKIPSRFVRRSFCWAALSLSFPASLSAQTVVRVESAGAPVGSADVSIWDADGRFGAGRSNDAGVVRIVPERLASPQAFLLVRRLGFAPRRLDYSPRDTIVVTLSAVPVQLPVLAVNTAPLRCPAATEPAADSLWRAVAARYTPGARSLRMEWTGYIVREAVPAEQRGFADPHEIRAPVYGHGTSEAGEAGMHDPPPYALYERHVDLGGQYWRWRYAALASQTAEHFLSERFREHHDLVVLGSSGASTIIGFCPRGKSEAEIEGELQVGPDSLLSAARWQFVVSHDDEDAGGETTFAPTTHEGHSYLIAIRGSNWRRARPNLYNQTRFERVRWELHAPE
jgi:hypothetical protein